MPEAAAAYVAEYLAFDAMVGATLTSVGYYATYVAVTAAINYAAMEVLGSGGQGGTVTPQSLNTSVRQSGLPRRLIYGTVKAGGVLVYPAQSDDGEYVHLALYLGEGPIDGIDPVFWVGDDLSTDPKFDGLLTLEAYTGAPGQTASTALVAASGGEWTTADVGTGCAYAVTRYKWDRNAFPRGLVLPAFLVRGRLLYDPRTNTTAHSANPALVLLDYIRSEFGYAAPTDWIDMDSFAAAAAVCDELVDSIDPANTVGGVAGKVRRYTCNGVFEASGSPASVVATIEASMAGKLVFCGGKYRAYAGAYRAPTGPTLTGEYLRADPTMRTHASRQQRINVARGTYREPRQDWQTVDYLEQSLPAAQLAEAGEIVQNINLPVTTNGATAQRLARIAMRQARSAVPLSLPCNWAAFQWRLYDTVSVSLPEIGAVGTYLITSYTFAQGGGIDLVLVPHLASDYAWTPATDEALVPQVIRPDFNSTPPAILGLTVFGGAVDQGDYAQVQLSAEWTPTVDAFLDDYEAQYKRSDSADGWTGGTKTNTPSASWQPQQGIEYDVRVRVVRHDGTTGPWAMVTNTLVTGDNTPPGPPTLLSVIHHGGGGSGTHQDEVFWTTPSDLDFSRCRVWLNTVNNPATATQVAEVFGLPGTAYSVELTHSGGTDTYYWVSAIDRTGNTSARTFAGSA